MRSTGRASLARQAGAGVLRLGDAMCWRHEALERARSRSLLQPPPPLNARASIRTRGSRQHVLPAAGANTPHVAWQRQMVADGRGLLAPETPAGGWTHGRTDTSLECNVAWGMSGPHLPVHGCGRRLMADVTLMAFTCAPRSGRAVC